MVPGMATDLSGSATESTITLTWTPPAYPAGHPSAGELNNGGSPIIRYEYSQKTGGGNFGEWTAIVANALFSEDTANEGTLTTTPAELNQTGSSLASIGHTVTGLNAGTAYEFRVRAVNATGAGPPAELADPTPVYPGTTPPAPANLFARAVYDRASGLSKISLLWISGGDGGSPITKWEYRTHTTQAGLTDDSLSTWVGICDDDVTTEAPRCTPVTRTVTLPRAPATPGGTSIDSVLEGGIVGGLGTGTNVGPDASEHYFIVRATNAHGPGFSSGVASVRFSVTVPSAIKAVYVQSAVQNADGTFTVTLSWQEPAAGGSPITDYEYSAKAGSGGWGAWTSVGNATGPADITIAAEVSNGTPLRFSVRAVNAIGQGGAIVSPAIDKGGPPSPGASDVRNTTPLLDVNAGDRQATLGVEGTTGAGTSSATRWEYSYRVGRGRYTAWSFSNSGLQFDPSNINPIDGLENGRPHTFRIRALNPGGYAGPVLESRPVVPGVAPPAPQGLRSAAGDRQVTLSWTSGGTGGKPITGWQLCGGAAADVGFNTSGATVNCGDSGADWADIPRSGPGTTRHTITRTDPADPATRLVNGTSYVYLIRAVSGDLHGARALAFAATPGRAPGAPSRMLVDGGDAQVTITVFRPSQVNGSNVVGYQVRKRQGNGPYDAWEALGTTVARPSALVRPSAESGAAVTGLVNGAAYTFQVRAVNGFGPGGEIESQPVTPVGAPTAGMLGADPGDGRVVLTWVPGNSGGRTITKWQYRMRIGLGGFGAWADIAGSGPATASHTVEGLSNGVSYTFQVRAVNELGAGAPIESAVVAPSAVPPAPELAAARGNGQVDLTWTAGASGAPGEAGYAAPTTGWQVRVMAAGGEYGAWSDIAGSGPATTSHSVEGLHNGIAYSFEVRAVNGVNAGEAGRAGPVTPATVPREPWVTAERGDGTTLVTWRAGHDGGSPVVGWQLQVNGGEWADISGEGADITSHSVATDDGTAYTFGVRAVNDVGEGPAGTYEIPASGAPQAPVVTAIGGNGEITVSWTARGDGGSTVIGWQYRMKVSIGDYGDWADAAADASTVTLPDLGGGTGDLSYTFQVRGVNGVGPGMAGTSNEALPIAPPRANGVFYAGVIGSPDFCSQLSLGGARLFAHDSDGDGTADVCSLPYTRREAIARQNAVEALAIQYAAEYEALVNAACAVTEGDGDCGGDMLTALPVVQINDGGPYYSGVITGPSFCANRSLGGPTTYPHDDDKDGVADVCALPFTRREAIARQLAGDVLAATHPAEFQRELAKSCRKLTNANYGDTPAHLSQDACAT